MGVNGMGGHGSVLGIIWELYGDYMRRLDDGLGWLEDGLGWYGMVKKLHIS